MTAIITSPSASSISTVTSASVHIYANRVLITRPIGYLPLTPGEIRHAPLRHCLHAFLEILGDAQAVLLLEFMVGRGAHAVGQTGPHGGPGRDEAERRVLRDFGRELERRAAHLIEGHKDVGEAPLIGLFAGDAPARIEHERSFRRRR